MIGATTTHILSTDEGTTYTVGTANIKDLTFPEMARDTSEDSYLDAADKYKEFVAGMIDGGEMSLVLKWNMADTGQVQMMSAFEGDGNIWGQIKFPDNSTYSYKGVVTGAGKEVPKNETITQSFKVKITGKPVEAAAP